MKNLRRLFNFMIAFGVFVIIGTAGASDIGNITFNQCISRILIGFGFIGFGALCKVPIVIFAPIRKNVYCKSIG